MIKIDIISGFLGAGKTTLIKKLFESSLKEEKVVIIENEFGEIGIDGSFLKEAGVKIKEINAGCICCSLVGDFSTSIKELVSTYSPDRIIIEPSGVGKLSDIIEAVEHVDIENLKINILSTVVDASKAKIYLKNFGEFFLNQIEACNSIVISKTDKVKEDYVDELIKILKDKNHHANIISTPIHELNGNTLLNVLEECTSINDIILEALEKEHLEHDCGCHHHEHDCCEEHDHEYHHHDHECCGEHDHEHHEHHHHDDCCHSHHENSEHECCHSHHHDADEVFSSWGKETAKSFTKDELTSFLNKLNDNTLGIIIRSKGIVKAKDNEKWYYFDYVSGDFDIRLGEPEVTGRIVVIGSKINEDKINDLFMGNN